MRLTSAQVLGIAAALLLGLAVLDTPLHDRRGWLRLLRVGTALYVLGWIWFALMMPARQGKQELRLDPIFALRRAFASPYGFWEGLRRWVTLGVEESGFPYKRWRLLDDVWNNLAVLAPAGFLLPAAFPALRGRRFPWRAVGVVALWSLLTETAQYAAMRGNSDVGDVIANVLSGMIGAALWLALGRARAKARGGAA